MIIYFWILTHSLTLSQVYLSVSTSNTLQLDLLDYEESTTLSFHIVLLQVGLAYKTPLLLIDL
jgi:hypothetical protein